MTGLLTFFERHTFTFFTAVVSLTGFVYLYFDYFVEPPDPFAVVNHPSQPLILAIHIVAAPVLVLLFGLVWKSHTFVRIVQKAIPNRLSGWFVLIGFALMGFSGYFLQVVDSASHRTFHYWTHVISGFVFFFAFCYHWARGWKIRKQRQQAMTSEEITLKEVVSD